jgi:hypothetical protein
MAMMPVIGAGTPSAAGWNLVGIALVALVAHRPGSLTMTVTAALFAVLAIGPVIL